MTEQYINPEAKWFVIVDVTEPDFASVVNCTFDTKEGAKKLMENWKEEVARLINSLQIEGFDDYEIKLFLFQKAEEQK